MRGGLVLILTLMMALNSMAQEWSDKAQYEAYMKGDWEQVVELGKLAKKSGADYYYIRARNGYANFMLGKYFKAEKEFEKALIFNSSDPFAKRYGYWSSVYAGNVATALVKTCKMTSAEKDSFKVMQPKWFNGISFVGGYRLSSSDDFTIELPGNLSATMNPPSSMPYVSLFLNHQIGKRLSLNHGVNYLSQTRPGIPSPAGTENLSVWQVGYLASLSVQAAKHTTVTPSFIMQYWESGGNKVYDLSATVAVRQQFGDLQATLIGGYYQDTDTNKYMVGGSLTWYPLSSQKLYTVTSGGYNIGGDAPSPFIRQSIGGNVFKRAWISTSFTWNNQVIAFEDLNLDFANNSSDRLNWMWSLSPSYFVTEKLRLSVTYSVESRQFYLPGPTDQNPILSEFVGDFSQQYNFHSFYVGLNYNF